MASTGEAERVDAVSTSLGARFESQPNALNFLRLVLALGVLLWHAYSLQNDPAGLPAPVRRLAADVHVDGFFAISGFLICRAWLRRSTTRDYLLARARRLLPGFYACIFVTAFLLAPIAAWSADSRQPPLLEQIRYVVDNAALWPLHWEVDGGIGNGSLWSLPYEALCYLFVAGLGVLGWLRPRTALNLVVGSWVLSVTIAAWGLDPFAFMGIGRPMLMFFAGAALWFYRDLVPVTPHLAALSGLSVTAGAVMLPDYRIVGAPGLAYLCLYAGLSLGRFQRLRLRNDFSYGTYLYGMPVQQTMLMAGWGASTTLFFGLSVLAVAPFAAGSWFLVEKRVAALRSRRARLSQELLPAAHHS